MTASFYSNGRMCVKPTMRRWLYRVALVALITTLTIVFTVPSLQAQASATLPSNGVFTHGAAATLSPGDAVRITVWRQPEMSGEFEVAADGSLRHPLYRAVIVGGLTPEAAEARLRSYLANYEANPQFVVEPLFHVTVGGEIRQPNLYRLAPENTIADALARAGGSTERGRLDRVRLIRNGQVIFLDLTRPDLASPELHVRSGDRIIVERRQNLFRDVLAPIITVSGATAAIINVILRN